MDAEALEREGLAAAAAAGSTEEIEAVRVEYLGRKSALKQALREIRDRETGMSVSESTRSTRVTPSIPSLSSRSKQRRAIAADTP